MRRRNSLAAVALALPKAIPSMSAALPDLNNLVHVAQMRYVQSAYEVPHHRNPDAAVASFLSLPQRLAWTARAALMLSRLRANPFYYYLLARTRYYDHVFLDAVYNAARCILNIGCGTDSRAYRFAPLLRQRGVTVIECDQPEAIATKARLARRRWPTSHVRYVAVELNDPGRWSELARVLDDATGGRLLVMMEGVSPYIRAASFHALLALVAGKAQPGSRLVYDFKIAGVADGFARTDAVPDPFRLPGERAAVAAYHLPLGYDVEDLERSAALCRRLVPDATAASDEDCLVRLRVRAAPAGSEADCDPRARQMPAHEV